MPKKKKAKKRKITSQAGRQIRQLITNLSARMDYRFEGLWNRMAELEKKEDARRIEAENFKIYPRLRVKEEDESCPRLDGILDEAMNAYKKDK
jgi:hypothetical protein